MAKQREEGSIELVKEIVSDMEQDEDDDIQVDLSVCQLRGRSRDQLKIFRVSKIGKNQGIPKNAIRASESVICGFKSQITDFAINHRINYYKGGID